MALGRAGDDAMVFDPPNLSFEQGGARAARGLRRLRLNLALTPSPHPVLTRLTLTNPSRVEHYFSAREWASKVFTVLIEAGGTEIKARALCFTPVGWFH